MVDFTWEYGLPGGTTLSSQRCSVHVNPSKHPSKHFYQCSFVSIHKFRRTLNCKCACPKVIKSKGLVGSYRDVHLLCDTLDMVAVEHRRQFLCGTQYACLLCDTEDMFVARDRRHACCVTQPYAELIAVLTKVASRLGAQWGSLGRRALGETLQHHNHIYMSICAYTYTYAHTCTYAPYGWQAPDASAVSVNKHVCSDTQYEGPGEPTRARPMTAQ